MELLSAVSKTKPDKHAYHGLGLASQQFGVWNLTVTRESRGRISALANCEDWLEPVVFLTIFQETLRRFKGQSSVTVRFERNGSAVDLKLDGRLSLRDSVIENQRIASGSEGSNLDNGPLDGEFSAEQDSILLHDRFAECSNSSVHMIVNCDGDSVDVCVRYDHAHWDPSLMKSFSISYRNLLQFALAHQNTPLDQLNILTDSDLQNLDSWNNNACAYPNLRVSELVQQRAAEAPESPAVTFECASLTYGELVAQVNHLAAKLKAISVRPGSIVGICMDRSNEMLVALLAVFQAGGAYLPLDPTFPSDRIEFMQQDAQPLAIITQPHLCGKFAFTAEHVLSVDVLDGKTNREAAFASVPVDSSESELDDLAYVLYTSGSTGKPKGVQVTHRALTNLLFGVARHLPITSSDVFLATSTISFDISAFELFAPLVMGAHLVIAPRAVATNGERLANAIQATGATMLQATPSGWRVLLEAGWGGHPGLKMLTAGEPLDKTLAHRLLDRGHGLWNLYGPTEATIYATVKKISKDDSKITVGIPLPNYTAFVLDQGQKRLPVGAVGELYLGGTGIARGYLNRPELTTEKFVPNPAATESAGPLYRTGDLARLLPDGEIELLGRADNQIKLRGYRIELEEIEAVLDSYPAIRKSVAKVIDFNDGDQRLYAYVMLRSPDQFDNSALNEFASRCLPRYMVPASFVVVESFKLSPSGKIDRKALPEADRAEAASTDELDFASSLEKTVLSSWRDVLKNPDLHLDHNFFEAGGHSLLAARMFVELETRLGCKLPVSLLLEAPTARTFAGIIGRTREFPVRSVVSLQPKGTRPPLYLIHHLLGDVLIYRTLANCLAPNRPVFGIQPPVDLLERPQPLSLKALADEYVQQILERQKKGPFHLAGFSSGSVMAFEMARQLSELGHEVGLLALIDGDVSGHAPDMPKALYVLKVVIRKFAKIIFKMRDELSEGPKQFVGKRLRYLALLWRIRTMGKSTGMSELTMEQALFLAEREYTPKEYSGSALLIRFRDEAWTFGPDPMMGWRTLITGGIEPVDFPGGHITGMSPAGAPHLAATLSSHMEDIEVSRDRKIRSTNAAVANQTLAMAL